MKCQHVYANKVSRMLPCRQMALPHYRYLNFSNDVSPHFILMLWKTDDFSVEQISKVVLDVMTDMSITEANDKVLEALQTGKSVLRIYPEAKARLHYDTFKSKNVYATMERVELL
jgi:ATP-dependent Clp protease adapter protein ClpS